jgi:hypothetical protein
MRIIQESPRPGESVTPISEITSPPQTCIFVWGAVLYLIFSMAILIIPEIPRSYLTAHNPVTGEAITFLRSHIFMAPFFFLWAFAGFFSVALEWRIILICLIPAIIYIPRLGHFVEWIEARCVIRNRTYPIAAFFSGVTAIIIFFLARVSVITNMSFADASTLPQFIEQGVVFPAEVLTCYSYHFVRFLFWTFGLLISARTAIIMVNCLAGGLFVATMVLLAQSLSKSILQRIVTTLALILSGYTVTFFGYIETTQIELAAMAGFFCCAVTSLQCEIIQNRRRWELGAITFTSIALLAHAAGVLLLPALAFLLMKKFDGKPSSIIPGVTSLFSRRTIGLVFFLIVIPYVLFVVQPFYLQNDFGNAVGGADGIMFVPFRIDSLHPVSQYVHYSMFSTGHFFDILSSVILAVPTTILLIIGSWYLIRRRNISLTVSERHILWVTGAGAFFCGLIPLLWNHDFGMWGDWNIAVTYLFPLNLFAWILFTTVLNKCSFHPSRTYRLLLTLIGIQAILCLGILLQLY